MRTCSLIALAFALPAAAVVVDRIAVTVANRVITASDIETRLRLSAFQNDEQPDLNITSRRASVQRLIDQRRQQAPYRDRRIHFQVSVSPAEAKFVIRDDGPGFNPGEVPDCTDPANLERESGRGLLLMRTFMDDVQFTSNGNQVTLIKRSEPKK